MVTFAVFLCIAIALGTWSYNPPLPCSASSEDALQYGGHGSVVGGLGNAFVDSDATTGSIVVRDSGRSLVLAIGFGLGFVILVSLVLVCFTRTLPGSNWRILGGVMAVVSLGHAAFMSAGVVVSLANPNIRFVRTDAGVDFAMHTWGSETAAGTLNFEHRPRVIIFSKAGRRTSYNVAVVWSVESGVKAIWLATGSRESDRTR